MKITFETVDKLIKDGDIKNLTELVKEINSIKKTLLGDMFLEADKKILRFIVSKFWKLLRTNPEFYYDDEFTDSVIVMLKKFYGQFFMNNSQLQEFIYYDNMVELIENRSEHRMGYIKAILKLFNSNISITLNDIMANILNVVFYYNDYELASMIADEFNDPESDIYKIITVKGYDPYYCTWILVFVDLLIENELYDVLDKVKATVYENNEFTSIKPVDVSLHTSWVKIVKFLYNRYVPNVTNKEIGEKIINENSFWEYPSILCNFSTPLPRLSKDDIIELIESGAKITELNKFMMYLDYFLSYDIADMVADFIDDNALFYLNSCTSFSQLEYEKVKRIVAAKPGIRICIGNNPCSIPQPQDTKENLIFNNRQIKNLLSGRRLVLTEEVKENMFIRNLIKTKNKAVFIILDKLEPDELMCGELAELCAEYKNLELLRMINEHYNPKNAEASKVKG